MGKIVFIGKADDLDYFCYVGVLETTWLNAQSTLDDAVTTSLRCLL